MSPVKVALIIIVVAAILGATVYSVATAVAVGSTPCHPPNVATTIVLITGQSNSSASASLLTITNSTSSIAIQRT